MEQIDSVFDILEPLLVSTATTITERGSELLPQSQHNSAVQSFALIKVRRYRNCDDQGIDEEQDRFLEAWDNVTASKVGLRRHLLWCFLGLTYSSMLWINLLNASAWNSEAFIPAIGEKLNAQTVRSPA